ncbi:MAG: hypothetical protein ABJB74_21915 [Gemmatimonas sp.]
MIQKPIDRAASVACLDRVLSSAAFRTAERSSSILRFLVLQTLDGQAERLKEYTVGLEALGRGVAFDPRTDPIVRAEASRLRSRLERYYATDGSQDAVIIALPKGSYVPEFHRRSDTVVPPRNPRGRAHPIAWLLAGSLGTVAAVAVGAWMVRQSSTPLGLPLRSYDVQLQSSGLVTSEVGTDVVLTPDGSRAVFVSADSSGHVRLRVLRFDVDGSLPVDLPGTEGARGPFISPDGRWVGFWADRKLKKTALEGGSPTVLCEASDLLGASWGEDGMIVAALSSADQLSRVASAGGSPVPVIDLATDGVSPRWPQILPGGTRVLYTALGTLGADRANIELVSIADGQRKVLIKGGTFGRYVAPGFLTYVNQGTLYGIRFDIDRFETRGAAVPIVRNVAYSGTFGYAQLDYTPTGMLAYKPMIGSGNMVVAMLDSAGRAAPLIDTPGRYVWPSLSPDGRRLAVSVTASGVSTVSIFEIARDRTVPAIMVAGIGNAIWSRDGRFLVGSGASGGLAWIPGTGGTPHPISSVAVVGAPWTFTPDGHQLAFHAMAPATALDLWTVSIEETNAGLTAGRATPLLQTTFFEVYPTYSPDGRWLAYGSNESGTWEVYVRAVPDNGSKVRVSSSGGRVPHWSKTRRELLFGTDDQHVLVAPYAIVGDKFIADPPTRWTERRLGDTGVLPNFDVTSDARHIVALLPATTVGEKAVENHVTLLFHVVDELRRRLP